MQLVWPRPTRALPPGLCRLGYGPKVIPSGLHVALSLLSLLSLLLSDALRVEGRAGHGFSLFADEVGEEVVAVVRGMAEAAVGEGGELRAPELILYTQVSDLGIKE